MATREIGNLEGSRVRAQHVADALGQFIGTLHAARLTALIGIQQAGGELGVPVPEEVRPADRIRHRRADAAQVRLYSLNGDAPEREAIT
ncbi:MAG TPA: hypothetical protein VLA62_08705 [Solirubrobacterales bacterium]|nr:hypothetical protein [Solirubrobacterales bacterium]